MKRMKKIMAVALAAAMALAMSVTAFAQDVDANKKTDGATITVKNASNGVTYTVYKVFDATVKADGSSISYSKTGFTANDYFDVDTAGNITAKDAAYETPSNKANSGLSDGAIAWIKQNGTQVASAKSDGSTLVFKNLEYGYYYVTSDLKENGAVTVTSTMPNAEIKDKNSKSPDWTDGGKKVKNASGTWVEDTDANIGENIDFKISIETTNYVDEKQIKEYVIADTFPAGMELVSIDSIKVKRPSDSGETDITPVTKPTAFPVTVSWVDTNGSGNNATYTSKYPVGTTLTVYFKAKLKDTAVIAGAGNENKASFTWNYTNSDETGKPSTETDTATVKTYAIAIKKVNEKGEALENATFTFPFYVKSAAASDGSYVYGGSSSGDGLTNTLTTPSSGEITIKGVKAGTYSITETAAPSGYNKLTASVSAEAKETSATTVTTTKYIQADGTVGDTTTTTGVTYTNSNFAADVLVVVNKSGKELPETGGMGTTLFYMIGSVLVIGAGIVMITRRRMGTM